MVFEDGYSKRLRLRRDLAQEFTSCRQFLRTAPSGDNDLLRAAVVNNAIKHSFETGFLKTLTDLCNHSRLNGTNVDVTISKENWYEIVSLLNRKLRKLDEWDLIEHCLDCYLKEVKLKGALP